MWREVGILRSGKELAMRSKQLPSAGAAKTGEAGARGHELRNLHALALSWRARDWLAKRAEGALPFGFSVSK